MWVTISFIRITFAISAVRTISVLDTHRSYFQRAHSVAALPIMNQVAEIRGALSGTFMGSMYIGDGYIP